MTRVRYIAVVKNNLNEYKLFLCTIMIIIMINYLHSIVGVFVCDMLIWRAKENAFQIFPCFITERSDKMLQAKLTLPNGREVQVQLRNRQLRKFAQSLRHLTLWDRFLLLFGRLEREVEQE